MTTASGERDGAEAIDLRFITRDVSAEAAAAVTAVILAAVGEEASAPPPTARSEWSHPRHALRPQVEVGPGRWSSALR
ncbi:MULTISPECIES: acyl-CoA carboxylase epsilon subunit [unclassified Agromyces]|uniref:acyl-CoA carboxylase epsilon subunit n=1 Tax=unclassified Agromyces TaxID=2639701 RepID=UPI003014DD8D